MMLSVLLQLSQTGYFMLLAGLFFFPLLVALVTAKDIFFNENLSANLKLVWLLIVILIPLLGAIIYFFWAKPVAARKKF
ncbi:hypothetical protein PBAC_19010 [Pedobacter glucosidilyticus]|uniref:Cardiolipin synthase N-terminal domain-containing protein n=1 Tax=Pedobacter aquae TaxID=2605747 RepID=A0A5C0VM95_9SPHI|nr:MULTISPECIES: PLDc N-terminal domain-containing protein [Pedobacter]KHJ37889.1 hypothetical protein PBAC_19010 [Pedobacter glucosidilyticus]QEK52721.1 hypothetical protein FYC62_14435 [Pedobacter aquae]